MKKLTLLFTTLFLAFPTLSKASNWKIVEDQSKIGFAAMQNSSVIIGSFKKISGKINFDPKELKSSKVEIEVDINSVESSTPEAASTLKTADWFSAKLFPKATFVSTKFIKVSDKQFIAEGNLTIKGKTVAEKIDFTLEEYSDKKAVASGVTKIKRSDFAVGAKDPANAHGVKDEVAVSFMVTAVK